MNKKIRVLVLTLAFPAITFAQQPVAPDSNTMLYASLGERILGYRLDVEHATLRLVSERRAPANLQFAVKNATGQVLYAASSNAGSGTLGAKGDTHIIQAYSIDINSGILSELGDPITLPERPINLGLDHRNRFVVVAFNQSGTLSVHPIRPDGSVSPAVAQNQVPQAGIFTHQVTFTPNDQYLIALARGNEAVQQVPDQPGSVNSFSIDDQGILQKISTTPLATGVGPRHLAYHPNQRWVYVAMERGSQLHMYKLTADGSLEEHASFKKNTLENLANLETPRQRGGVVQMSPDGRFIYVSNRADAARMQDGKRINSGGENNIVVFAVDPVTGEPRHIQTVSGEGIEARTMKVDPTGKLLIVANQLTQWVREHNTLRKVPSNLAVFQIDDSGKLQFVRRYEMDDESKSLLWMDI